MITVSFFISFAIILLLFFILIRKKNNKLTLLFVLLGMEYLFTSFISVIADNEKLWRISKEPSHFVMFRVAEVVVIPLLLLWYLEFDRRVHSLPAKVTLFVIGVLSLTGIEKLLVLLKVMDQVNWPLWASLVSWIFILAFTRSLGKLFSIILHKEGVKP